MNSERIASRDKVVQAAFGGLRQVEIVWLAAFGAELKALKDVARRHNIRPHVVAGYFLRRGMEADGLLGPGGGPQSKGKAA